MLLVPWICSRIGPRAETASMLRRSLPFQPTFEHKCQSPAHQPTIPPARHPGGQPSPADLCQGRRLLLQGLPGVRSITPRLGTEQASRPRDRHQVTRTSSEHSCSTCQGARSHADARSRLPVFSFASHARVAYVRCLSRSLDLTHCSLTPQTHSPQRQSSEPKP